jgi:hypothetical protein
MTVGELKAELAPYWDEMPVVLSRDSEGNEHRPLFAVDCGIYEPETAWSGNVLAKQDESDASGQAYRAVVLWPVN